MTPLLPLETFRKVLGWNPYFFWGLSNSDEMPVRDTCNAVVKQYAWQDVNAVGRYEIAQAIESAENLLQTYLGFNIAPKYTELTIPWPRFYDAARSRIGWWDATGRYIAPRLPFGHGYVQALGTELLTLVGTATVAGGTLVFSNQFNGAALSLDDTFTITIPTTETDPNKLAVYFAAADRPDGAAISEQWRVRPVQVTISGGVATITGRIWLIVRPVLYEAATLQPLDPADTTASGPYAQSLLVYTRTTNPAGTTWEDSELALVWETSPAHGWWCGCGCQQQTVFAPDGYYDPAGLGYAAGRGVIRDAGLGIIGMADAIYNTAAGAWYGVPWADCREPDSVIVRFLAGYPLGDDGNVAKKYEQTVVRLALAELGFPICACEQANRDIYHWQQDLSRSQGTTEVFGFISREDLGNPFGTRRGAIWAWHQVRNTRLTPGVVGF